MNSFYVFLVFALTAMVAAEAPGGYNYPRGGGGGGGFGGFGGGGFGGGGGGGLFGGTYRAVSGGFQTSEGIRVEPQLLEQVRRILLNEESKLGGSGGGGGGGGGGGYPSSSYGAPSPQYGVPAFDGGRVVGIDLEGVRQAIQVAQFEAQTTIAGGGGGYPAARPSSSYGSPF